MNYSTLKQARRDLSNVSVMFVGFVVNTVWWLLCGTVYTHYIHYEYKIIISGTSVAVHSSIFT